MAEAGSLGGMPESLKYAGTELVVQGAASGVEVVVYPAEVEGGYVVGGKCRRPMWSQCPFSSPCNESLGWRKCQCREGQRRGNSLRGCRVDDTWAMEVELDALEGVNVANTSVTLSPTGKLNAKMLDRAVIVGGAVQVPITTAEVPNPSSPLIPPVLSIRARALSGQRKFTKVCHKRRGFY